MTLLHIIGYSMVFAGIGIGCAGFAYTAEMVRYWIVCR